MEAELWAVLAVLFLVLLTTFVLTSSVVLENKSVNSIRSFYESYVDSIVVALGVLFAVLTFVMASGIYLSTRGAKDAYIAGAIFLLTLQILLSAAETYTGIQWLLKPVLHLINLGTIFLLFLALRD